MPGAVGAVLLAALGAPGASGLAGCASARAASSISVASAYVPEPTTPGTTVAYLVIRNNGTADRLIAVHTSVGGKVLMRAPLGMHAGTLIMHTVPDIPVPAGSLTRLDPDGDHLLITGAGSMPSGKDITLQLTFANAGTVTIIAMVTDPQSGGSSYFLN